MQATYAFYKAYEPELHEEVLRATARRHHGIQMIRVRTVRIAPCPRQLEYCAEAQIHLEVIFEPDYEGELGQVRDIEVDVLLGKEVGRTFLLRPEQLDPESFALSFEGDQRGIVLHTLPTWRYVVQGWVDQIEPLRRSAARSCSRAVHEGLAAAAFHPTRIQRILDLGGFDMLDNL
jgi:hypothetical protein